LADRLRGSEMTGRKAQGWQGVVVGAVMIVVGVVLMAKHVPVFGVSALPIVGAGTAPLLVGLRQLFAARQDHRAK
jgi:predicted phage tail protein